MRQKKHVDGLVCVVLITTELKPDCVVNNCVLFFKRKVTVAIEIQISNLMLERSKVPLTNTTSDVDQKLTGRVMSTVLVIAIGTGPSCLFKTKSSILRNYLYTFATRIANFLNSNEFLVLIKFGRK